jgi:hypothetical protein
MIKTIFLLPIPKNSDKLLIAFQSNDKKGEKMKLEEILEQLDQLTDEELDRLAKAASFELQDRELRKVESLEESGLVPLYRCRDPEHQREGLYARDLNKPEYLVCGCLVKEASLEGFE